ncbi:MAG: hypothetical protein A2073_02950 [Deltaproteobacteria bacterium GWC2_42_11]|nr:MAG: hypothetical protein A2073_02950 [Deltaproteobacteria bacterium GWC2_42_11]HBO84734.1 hypothetical protein [Deltaproteobacteria bacterium]
MAKIILLSIICLITVIHVPVVLADIYEWTDEKGNIHVVDDILNVPAKYRDKVKIYKEKPVEIERRRPVEERPEQTISPPSEELFGNYPLEWWKAEFEKIKRDISELEKTISEQKRYVDVFERGRRLGQTYTKDEIEAYDQYKKQITESEARLKELKSEFDELRRKAASYGVPRSIRGD